MRDKSVETDNADAPPTLVEKMLGPGCVRRLRGSVMFGEFGKAIDPLDAKRGVHAVSVDGPGKTLCGLHTAGLVIQEGDWETGSHRASCADCVDLMALRHMGGLGPDDCRRLRQGRAA